MGLLGTRSIRRNTSGTRLPLFVAALSLLAIPCAARAATDGWQTSLSDGKAVGSYLASTRPRVMVVAAGKPAATSRPACQALLAGLRASNRAALVMDDTALEDLSGIADKEIIRRAFQQPIDVLAIVRVVEGGGGGADVAVVTFYNGGGKVLSAFSAEKGAALEPLTAPAEAATDGVGSAASRAVDEVVHAESPRVKLALDEYGRRMVWFDESHALTIYGRYETTRTFLGKFRRPLEDDAAFYEAVDREDLAKSFRSRRTLRNGLFALGGIGLGIGVFGALISWPITDLTGHRDGNIPLTIFLVAAPIGIAGIVAGAVLPSLRADMGKRRELASEHNNRVRQELGLPPLAPGAVSVRPSAPAWQLAVAPVLRRDGAGVGFSLVF